MFAHQPTLGGLRPEFISVIKEKYSSDLQPLDFGNEAHARSVINDWVSEKTSQKIKELIPSGMLSALTRLVLVNAVYFKGDWKTKFNANDTRSKTFYPSPNKELKIDMMYLQGQKFYYKENKGFQVLGMPYKGEELSMFVFLPRQRDGLAELEKSPIGRNFLETVSTGNKQQKLDLVMFPKFKLEKQIDLVKILAKLGATDMFDDKKADFSNINGRRDLKVSDVIHNAFVEVNEEGTEVAAATGVVHMLRCATPRKNPSFVADHPFLFAIVDVRSTSILFLGRYFGK